MVSTSRRLDRDSGAWAAYADRNMSLRIALISKVAASTAGRREAVRN